MDKIQLKGIRNINTTTKSGRRRPRTVDGMLSELVQLKLEKSRLIEEKKAWQERIKIIDARLAEIAEKEKPMQQLLLTAEENTASLARVAGGTNHVADGAGHKENPNEVIIRY